MTETAAIEVGSPAWFERRARLWAAHAHALVAELRDYEECHPAVSDVVPCLQAALEQAEEAVSPQPAAPRRGRHER